MMANERGIALVITLLVVSLLTIIVVEFTYSAEVDAHMARNALNALQASLLARSGINLGEAFLLHDDDAQVDSYLEDWGNLDEINSQLILPDNMRLRVQIIDEGGKLNINLTRPRTVQQVIAALRAGPDSPAVQLFQSWTTALGNLLEGRGASPEVAENVAAYWVQLFQAAYPSLAGGLSPGSPDQGTSTPVPGSTGTPTPGAMSNNPFLWDFPSLDDTSVIPGLTPSLIRRSREVVTALDSNRQPWVNINTAPPEVLGAIIPDAGIVENIISQRQDQPLKAGDMAPLLAGLSTNDAAARNARGMLRATSFFFLIRASAVVNPNPITGKGGISRSASMLVRREPRPGVPPNAPPGVPRWTLTQLDWQKEGGAALFQPTPGADDLPNAGLPGMGG
jgi:type II secretory pathway component PulK